MENMKRPDRKTALWTLGSTVVFGRHLQPIDILLRGSACAPFFNGLFPIVWSIETVLS
ncbi:MAG: hypothetical protein GX417_11535 [Clostridiales bacterium]|nr:hypothetical protein [Clostridiales bacterium]